MTGLIAALPMYDWPEFQHETDAQWAAIAGRLERAGIAAPDRLTRSNGDLPPMADGMVDRSGGTVASDPAHLPAEALDLPVLWRHPALLFAQTCWGPLERTDLLVHVDVIGQPDYSDVEGGAGTRYSSAVLMRRGDAPAKKAAGLPVDALRGGRFAFNDTMSMSGLIALDEDLAAQGAPGDIFAARFETGSHRASARAVAEGDADICALDCRSWAMLRRVAPETAAQLAVVGWTRLRPGLPFITGQGRAIAGRMRAALGLPIT